MGRVGRAAGEPSCRVVDMCQREVGALAPRVFSHRAAASPDLVLRLGLHKKLDKHRGCVNTVSFNSNGNILVSGSDDRMVILWDWETGIVKLSFHSGHSNNVFQARFMPFTDDRTIVTCAADGQVRFAQLQDGGYVATRMLAKHEGRAHKMAIEPGSPHILYSCGEDGLVYHFDLRANTATKLFKCKTFNDKSYYMPFVHLLAIAIDPRNPNCFAIAGSDEYARIYDIRKCRWDGKECCNPINCFCPPHLIGDDQVGITGLAFSSQSELLASYNLELIYLFSKDEGLGPNPVSATPRSNMDIDARDHTFENPVNQCTENLNAAYALQSYAGHSNSDTVKGVSFFGPNCEYVASGSDCGRVFIWQKKGRELLRVMEGDKRIVNCVEPHPCTTMLASSGIENDIKIWIPNAEEPAKSLDIDEIMMHGGVGCFLTDDSDSDFDNPDASDDDDDSNSSYSLDIDGFCDNELSDADFSDEIEDDDVDSDDDANSDNPEGVSHADE